MKVLIVGANSILSKAIVHQHPDDEIEAIYHHLPSIQPAIQHPLSNLHHLRNDYDWIYIVSAVISNEPEDSKLLFDINVELVKKISKQFPKAKLIYFSTVAVYDGLNNATINEQTLPSPASFYGISKLWAENIVKLHSKFCILRISSMHGIGMKNTTFLPKIIDNAIHKNEITLIGTGGRKQNYIHANDVAVLAKKLAGLAENKIQLAISSVNYSNKQIGDIIQNITNCRIKYEGEDTSRSVEYSQNSFPYAEYNLTGLNEGIKELIEWKRKQF